MGRRNGRNHYHYDGHKKDEEDNQFLTDWGWLIWVIVFGILGALIFKKG